MMFTLIPCVASSCCALMAPALIDFQNSWVVPFGITAIWSVVVGEPAAAAGVALSFLEQADNTAARARPRRIFFMGDKEEKAPECAGSSRQIKALERERPSGNCSGGIIALPR